MIGHEIIDLFKVFFKIGLYAFGGGPAMIPIMQGEVVEGKAWVSDSDFRTALAIGQSLPGPIAPELAMWVGMRVAGVPGAIAAAVAVVLPGMVLMGFFTAIFWSNADSRILKGASKGAGVAVIGLLAYVTYDQAYKLFTKDTGGNWLKAFTAHPDWIVIIALAFGFVLWRPNLMMPIVVVSALVYGAIFMR